MLRITSYVPQRAQTVPAAAEQKTDKQKIDELGKSIRSGLGRVRLQGGTFEARLAIPAVWLLNNTTLSIPSVATRHYPELLKALTLHPAAGSAGPLFSNYGNGQYMETLHKHYIKVSESKRPQFLDSLQEKQPQVHKAFVEWLIIYAGAPANNGLSDRILRDLAATKAKIADPSNSAQKVMLTKGFLSQLEGYHDAQVAFIEQVAKVANGEFVESDQSSKRLNELCKSLDQWVGRDMARVMIENYADVFNGKVVEAAHLAKFAHMPYSRSLLLSAEKPPRHASVDRSPQLLGSVDLGGVEESKGDDPVPVTPKSESRPEQRIKRKDAHAIVGKQLAIYKVALEDMQEKYSGEQWKKDAILLEIENLQQQITVHYQNPGKFLSSSPKEIDSACKKPKKDMEKLLGKINSTGWAASIILGGKGGAAAAVVTVGLSTVVGKSLQKIGGDIHKEAKARMSLATQDFVNEKWEKKVASPSVGLTSTITPANVSSKGGAVWSFTMEQRENEGLSCQSNQTSSDQAANNQMSELRVGRKLVFSGVRHAITATKRGDPERVMVDHRLIYTEAEKVQLMTPVDKLNYLEVNHFSVLKQVANDQLMGEVIDFAECINKHGLNATELEPVVNLLNVDSTKKGILEAIVAKLKTPDATLDASDKQSLIKIKNFLFTSCNGCLANNDHFMNSAVQLIFPELGPDLSSSPISVTQFTALLKAADLNERIERLKWLGCTPETLGKLLTALAKKPVCFSSDDGTEEVKKILTQVVSNRTKAIDVARSALVQKMSKWVEAGNDPKDMAVVELDMTSVSLVTPDEFRAEKGMLDQQREAFAALETLSDDEKRELLLDLTAGGRKPLFDRKNLPQLKISTATFNFGVNEGERMGRHNQSVQNTKAKIKLLSRAEIKIRSLESFQQEALSKLMDKVVGEFNKFDALSEPFAVRSYFQEPQPNPYMMPVLIMALDQLCDGSLAFNCMSGKDRTGMADVFAKRFMADLTDAIETGDSKKVDAVIGSFDRISATFRELESKGLIDRKAEFDHMDFGVGKLFKAGYESYDSRVKIQADIAFIKRNQAKNKAMMLHSGNREVQEENTTGWGYKLKGNNWLGHNTERFFQMAFGTSQTNTSVITGFSSNFSA